jgi:hypothetical protein
MTPRELDEYRALRDTIRERGTARHWMVVLGLAVWAALVLGTAALVPLPVATVVPLLFLAAAFEVVFALHTGVERVGRYIAVFHETEAESAKWEHVAMAFGRTFRPGGIDAMFSPFFLAATVLNLVPAAMQNPVTIEWAVVGAAHLLLVVRIVLARRQAAKQRPLDEERFRRLRGSLGHEDAKL